MPRIELNYDELETCLMALHFCKDRYRFMEDSHRYGYITDNEIRNIMEKIIDEQGNTYSNPLCNLDRWDYHSGDGRSINAYEKNRGGWKYYEYMKEQRQGINRLAKKLKPTIEWLKSKNSEQSHVE